MPEDHYSHFRSHPGRSNHLGRFWDERLDVVGSSTKHNKSASVVWQRAQSIWVAQMLESGEHPDLITLCKGTLWGGPSELVLDVQDMPDIVSPLPQSHRPQSILACHHLIATKSPRKFSACGIWTIRT